MKMPVFSLVWATRDTSLALSCISSVLTTIPSDLKGLFTRYSTRYSAT
jgi:hypothetical protein